MDTTGFALPGGLPVGSAAALALLEEAAARGCEPLLATEVSVNDAAALAAALAARRPQVPLGTGIIPLGSRTLPAVAMGAATVAGLSESEFLLGVGVSTAAVVAGWHGAEWDPSVDTTRERLRTLRALLDGQPRGSWRLGAPPGRRVRVLLGALGPRMIALGMEAADGVICNLTPPERLPSPAGDSRVVSYVWTAVDDAAVEAARRDLVTYATTAPYARHFRALGFGEAVDEVRALRAEGRLREAPGRLPTELVARLVVRPDALPDHLGKVRAVGAVPVVLPFCPHGQDAVEAVRAALACVPVRPDAAPSP